MKNPLHITIRQTAPRLAPNVVRHLPALILVGAAVHLLLPQITTLESSLKIIEQLPILIMGLALMAQIRCCMGSGYVLRAIAILTGINLSLLCGIRSPGGAGRGAESDL